MGAKSIEDSKLNGRATGKSLDKKLKQFNTAALIISTEKIIPLEV